MESIKEVVNNLSRKNANKTEKVCKALVGIGIDPKNCFLDQNQNLIIPFSAIPEPRKIANRKFIEDVIDLHKLGKSVERIMFSLDLSYEEPEDGE